MTRLFTFIGVSTGGSSIMRIFPRWRDALGLGADLQMAGWDIEVGAPAERYRSAVEELRADTANLGALVTTHKVALFRAAGDLLDGVDGDARICQEVSCLAKRDGGLLGWAKDPVASGRALEELLATDHFRSTGAEVLCMGAGGSGVAIAVYLAAQRQDRPARLFVSDTSLERLERLAEITRRAGAERVEPVLNDRDGIHERLLQRLPPGSLVVNATGMGKDRPGSPLSDRAVFPERAVAWELNYRGELGFLHQARTQRRERQLRVEDGWRYFIFGWTAVMEEVFRRPIGGQELELLAREAEFARPSHDEEEEE